MIDKIRLMRVNKKIENGYYDNAANIKELKELERELVSSQNNGFVSKDTYRIKSLIIYNDGIRVIRDGEYSIMGFRIPQPIIKKEKVEPIPKIKKQKGAPVVRKKDRKAKRLAKRR